MDEVMKQTNNIENVGSKNLAQKQALEQLNVICKSFLEDTSIYSIFARKGLLKLGVRHLRVILYNLFCLNKGKNKCK